ncbi:hypothetical protein EZV62_014459 [Acer yangbiense]|uniref:Glycoside hydrolase family 19 catalytic domain-containing protein n=1 Tax=Acer yangbiense TaxID=1000413 RepID=A0A5C7HUB4_9ROSI|nr:hypothetical protein EZV62_014459 [Acer yangbiense]
MTPTPTVPSGGGGGDGGDVGSIISQTLFNQLLKYRNDARCPSNVFYTYNAFIAGARSFNGFGTTGDANIRRRELAAFLAQTSHETTGTNYNYNYGQAGRAFGADLINNPDLVATDLVISFRTAIWFWMTPQGNKPSSHYVITGRWTLFDADKSANRVLGYGVITNTINGGEESRRGANDRVASMIGFYRRYCDILGVSYGNNLDCYN